MGKQLITRWFLGSNSASGFHSLYGGFCSGENDFLRVIKGGPGTGKSGLMRRIGDAAEQRGLDVEYILCSGDPDSLDGIYIPALGLGYADGTSPHVLDPTLFGVRGSYLDVGACCGRVSDPAARREISELTRAYREHYAAAYSYLAAAGRQIRRPRALCSQPTIWTPPAGGPAPPRSASCRPTGRRRLPGGALSARDNLRRRAAVLRHSDGALPARLRARRLSGAGRRIPDRAGSNG